MANSVGSIRPASSGSASTKSPRTPLGDKAAPNHTGYGFSRTTGTAAVSPQDIWPTERPKVIAGLGNENVHSSGMLRPLHKEGGLEQAMRSLPRCSQRRYRHRWRVGADFGRAQGNAAYRHRCRHGRCRHPQGRLRRIAGARQVIVARCKTRKAKPWTTSEIEALPESLRAFVLKIGAGRRVPFDCVLGAVYDGCTRAQIEAFDSERFGRFSRGRHG